MFQKGAVIHKFDRTNYKSENTGLFISTYFLTKI